MSLTFALLLSLILVSDATQGDPEIEYEKEKKEPLSRFQQRLQEANSRADVIAARDEYVDSVAELFCDELWSPEEQNYREVWQAYFRSKMPQKARNIVWGLTAIYTNVKLVMKCGAPATPLPCRDGVKSYEDLPHCAVGDYALAENASITKELIRRALSTSSDRNNDEAFAAMDDIIQNGIDLGPYEDASEEL